MKTILIFGLALLGIAELNAQNCSGFYYMMNNAEIVMTNFDKKGKESGTLTYKISNVTTTGDGMLGQFNSTLVDEKGKLIANGAGKYKCSGDVMMIDAKAAVPAGNMAAYRDMDITADEVYIEYPATMTDGQNIKDLDFGMTIWSKGSKFSEIDLKETNRKIAGKETITTPAGTWDAWKISYDGMFRAKIGPIGIPVNFKAIEWYVPGFGIVKSETYSKNGKLEGSSVITAIKK